jgi:AraC family transcriptional activator of pobA
MSTLVVPSLPTARFAGALDDVRVRVGPIGSCRPPLVPGPHAHEYFAVLLFGEAGGWHELAGVRREVEPGVLVALPPGAVHDVAAVGGATVAFMPDAVSDARPPTRSCTVAVASGDRAELSVTIEALDRELRERRPGFRAAVRAQLSLLLVEVGRLVGDEPPDDPLLRDVLAVIDSRFRSPLSLAAIAAHVSHSPRHLTRLVSALTGATVMRLVDDRRMEEARHLLVDTDAQVDVIARLIGFSDGGYFRRRFRGAHGASPTEWRREHR